ncbi:MAG: PKD domain-containing protein [Bacteroidetes bacterium]|nr:PKD domain-containing protein [Bacteroidota bacterium]
MNNKFLLVIFILFSITFSQVKSQELTKVYPKQNYYTADTNIVFIWNSHHLAADYSIFLATDASFTNIVTTINNITSSFVNLNGLNHTTYYWKIQANLTSGGPLFSSVEKFTIFNPKDISNLQLWFAADSGITKDGFGKVSQWTDLSGNNNDAIQPSSSQQPLYFSNDLNQKPSVRFDGSDDLLSVNNFIPLKSIYIIANWNGNETVFPNYCSLLDRKTYSGGWGYLFMAEGNTSNFYQGLFGANININSQNNLNFSPFNNYKIISGFNDNNYAFDLNIGNSSSSAGRVWKGGVCEIVIYNSLLSTPEKNNIDNYLRFKYSPPVNLGPDINIAYGLCDTIIKAGSRFSNYIWSTGANSQSISAVNPGYYSVTATDIFGYQSADTILIYKPNTEINDTAICQSSPTLIDTHLDNNYSFSWSNGASTSAINVSTAGIYSVTVTDTLGCSQSKTITVTADMFSVNATLGPDVPKCIGDYIGLTIGAPAAEDYIWSDGSTNNSYLITGPGPIWLTVSDTNGCVAKDTINVSIAGQVPITAFMSDTVCVGSSTTFTDYSSASPNSITNWFWEFGDGTSSTNSNPTHVYTHDGIFNASLTSTSDAGCSKKITKQVLVLSLPIANFSPINACSGAPVNFLDKSICNFGNVTNWQWNFDDLSSGTQNTTILQNPTHTFNSPGTYHVMLIVKNKGLCPDTIIRTITVKGAPNVDFNYTSTCEGNPVYFTDITFTPPYAAITEWNWDFGDGNYSSLANPNHNFDTANIYSVKLELKSINGCIVSKTKPVEVSAIPFPDFTVNDLCQNTLYQLFDGSTVENSTIVDWNWNFGNGVTSSQQNPLITYNSIGEFNVQLSVKSAASCIASTIKNIVVYPAPIAEYSYTPDYGVAPLLVEFTNLTNQTNYFLWNFGDGSSTVSLENPNHTFTENGVYEVQFITTNLYGCKDTIIHEISVIPSSIDIALTKLTTTQINNFIKTSVNLVNLGTRNITNLDLTTTLHQSNPIKENWIGLLKPGESMTYNFTSEIEINPNKFPDYICAKVKISNILKDDNPANDEQCVTSLTEFTVLDLYPNPSDEIINIEYVLPFDENIGFDFFDSNGKRINSTYYKESKKGLNKISFPTSFLNSGIYAVKITFNDNSIIKKFMKNN